MRDFLSRQARAPHRHAWLWESMEQNPTFILRSMFGSKAVYLDGKMAACFCTKAEPWRGMLVCTEKRHHRSLMAEFPGLAPHPVLGKWLYLSESEDDFDQTAERIILQALCQDPRIGIVPPPKKK